MKIPLILALLFIVGGPLFAGEPIDPKFTKAAEKAAEQLHDKITTEIKSLGNHDWAGEYHEGDGLGENVSLTLAPNTGFVFNWHGCMGTYDRNYGAVTSSNGILHLTFTFRNERHGFEGIAKEFIPVQWGERKYLIPSDDVIGFCNEINSGDGVVGYLRRHGEEKEAVQGLPKVPEEFQPYLLKTPIEAKIVSVGAYTTRPSICKWKFKDTPVTINKGKLQGLLPGMALRVTAPGVIMESIKIISVTDNESQGVMTGIGEETPGPKVGWPLSTQAPWNKGKIDAAAK